VAVSAESIPLEDLETDKSSQFCGYYKMEVLGIIDEDHAKKFIKKHMSGEIVLFTDKNKAYEGIENIVDTHFTVVSGKESTNDKLKWVYKAISNLK
jgi:hypothetical protein